MGGGIGLILGGFTADLIAGCDSSRRVLVIVVSQVSLALLSSVLSMTEFPCGMDPGYGLYIRNGLWRSGQNGLLNIEIDQLG